MSDVTVTDLAATICFALAIAHTFSVSAIQKVARRRPVGSAAENILHLLGEVEIVFGVWAAMFILFFGVTQGFSSAIAHVETHDFTEPLFVFVVMAVCSTRPILDAAGKLIEGASSALPFPRAVSFYASCLIIGPLAGSFITEPAAMTVTALILLERFYQSGLSKRLMYATLGLLFVNVSIGGTLTPYAAPPVLMVASRWNWDLGFMFSQFGWKATLAVVLSTMMVIARFRRELGKLGWNTPLSQRRTRIPGWVTAAHFVFLALIVMTAHHIPIFAGIFLFFLGLVTVTKEHQSDVKLREGLLVAFFLGGLVVLGAPQRWWLDPLLANLGDLPLFLSALSLTAITDNAALTFLGAQVPSLSESARYALVAGAVAGGGLTVIANAPNPAGYGILNPSFGKEGINPLLLLAHAIPPTVIAALCFWFF